MTGPEGPRSAIGSLVHARKIGKLDEIFILHGIHNYRHLRVVASPRVILVSAQQVILALAGKSRDIIYSLKIGWWQKSCSGAAARVCALTMRAGSRVSETVQGGVILQ